MRWLSLLLALTLACPVRISAQQERPTKPVNLDFGSDHITPEGLPEGWKAHSEGAPDAFSMGLDPDVTHEGAMSAYVHSNEGAVLNMNDFATLTQSFRAEGLRGKRLRLTGYVRTEGVTGPTPEDGAGLWLRVAGKGHRLALLAFDNMADRRIAGGLAFDVVGDDVPTTDMLRIRS
jgi:hypothetical protein